MSLGWSVVRPGIWHFLLPAHLFQDLPGLAHIFIYRQIFPFSFWQNSPLQWFVSFILTAAFPPYYVRYHKLNDIFSPSLGQAIPVTSRVVLFWGACHFWGWSSFGEAFKVADAQIRCTDAAHKRGLRSVGKELLGGGNEPQLHNFTKESFMTQSVSWLLPWLCIMERKSRSRY